MEAEMADDEVYLNTSISLRARTSPPLATNSIESPIITCQTSFPSTKAVTFTSLTEVASRIRKTLR